MPRFNSPVYVVVHSYRHRLADTDGLSAKAVIDGMVHAGIFKSDTSKEIKEIRFRQTKIELSEDEKTQIIIKTEGEQN